MSNEPMSFPELAIKPERRRSTRRRTRLRAVLGVGAEQHRVDVLDFSSEGLRVGFVGPAPPAMILGTWPGRKVQVSTSTAASGLRLPAISARVARVGDSEVGLETDSLPDAWSAALSRALSAPPELSGDATASERIIRRCAGIYSAFARQLMSDVLAKVIEQCAARLGSDPFHAQRSGFAEAQAILSAERAACVDRFVEAAQKRVTTAFNDAANSARPTELESLRLMNSDELEDHLTLNGVISRLEKHFRPQADAFELRYTRVVGVPVNPNNNPYGVSATLRSFRESFHSDALKAPVWRLIYDQAESSARERFAELWRDLAQVVAKVEPAARQPRPLPAGDRAHGAAAREATLDSVERRLARMEEAAANLLRTHYAMGGGTAATPSQPGDGAQPGTFGHGAGGAGGSLADGGPGSAADGAAVTRRSGNPATSAPQPAGSPLAASPDALPRAAVRAGPARRLDVIADLSELSRRAPARTGEGDLISRGLLLPELEGANREADLSELLAAIDRLPLSSGPAFSETGLRDVAAQFIEHTPEGPKPLRRISETHQRVLYTAVQLFQQASREFTANSLIETLVKRLERTLLKLSLRDGEFPSSPQHPARKVIDLIDQYSLATDDQGHFLDAKLARNLEDLVDRICTQADHDERVFSIVQSSLESDLEELRRDRRQKIERICEAFASRDAIRIARADTDGALEQALSERRIPRILVRLIADCWRPYLVLTHLRHGQSSPEWKTSLRALEAALTLTQEDVSIDDTLQLREQVARHIEVILYDYPVEHDERMALMNQCNRLLIQGDPALTADRLQAPSFTEYDRQQPQTVRPMVGEWWEVSMGKQWIPVQLVWRSEATDFCGLVNRPASNRMELTYTELRERIEAGSARTRAPLDAPLLNRSEDILLESALSEALDAVNRDSRTGMLSRKAFQTRLGNLERDAPAGSTVTVAFVEFDQFRTVAATSGVDAVEALATTLGQRIARVAPQDSVIASLREDTFALLLTDYSPEAAHRTVEDLLAALTDTVFEHEQHTYRLGVWAGVGTFKVGQVSSLEMLRRVDAACLAAKASGRNSLRVYEPTAADLKHEESLLDWAGRADALLEGESLFLRCQLVAPIAASGKLKPYYEILLGVEAGAGQSASPFEVVTAMERLGRSHEIDLWVLRQAFDWIRDNQTVFDEIGALAINLSAASLGRPEITSFVRDQFTHGSVSPQHVIFEVTESAAIRSFDTAQSFIRELRRFGAQVSLDDFGSGYTSYAHLKKLSANTLKIDGSYVKEILVSDSDLAIVKSMTDIAHTLGMHVVAEWVETPEILARLLDLGVDYAQGYAVHKPVRLSQLLAVPARTRKT